MSPSRPPGIRLHLGFYHAGDPDSSTGRIRARLPGDETGGDACDACGASRQDQQSKATDAPHDAQADP